MTAANPALVIDALLATCRAAPSLEGVVVIDGPRLANDTGAATRDRLFVGATDDGTGEGADGTNTAPDGVVGVIDVETISIPCVAEAWSGSTQPTARRLRVFELLDAVRTLVRADDTGRVLGLTTLSSATVGSWQLIQVQTVSGFYAGLAFRVDCAARPST
jgi:hypothetical protein